MSFHCGGPGCLGSRSREVSLRRRTCGWRRGKASTPRQPAACWLWRLCWRGWIGRARPRPAGWQTLRDWVHRYNAEGLAGLSDRRKGVRVPRLVPAQMADLAAWVEAGPDPEKDGVVRWRRQDLQRRIAEAFGVEVHERTVGKYLAALGYRRLSVRPQHPRTDPGAQETFKKTSARQ